MLKSYVGIATRDGLEQFCPEHPSVTRFLVRQADRLKRRRAVCLWAVIPDTDADDVCDELLHGTKQDALKLLRRTAKELGPLLP